MILIECSPPFQWKPSFYSNEELRRFMWAWFAIAYVPYGFNEYIEGLAQAGADLYREGKLELKGE